MSISPLMATFILDGIAVVKSSLRTWGSQVETAVAAAVSAANAFGTDNRLIRSDGTGRGSQATGIDVDDNDNVKLPASLGLLGKISPSQITSSQNDYAPTGFANATVLRLSTDASRDLTGLAGGADGLVRLVHNVGSFNLVLKDESASSTAANRFALSADVTLQPDQSVWMWYDSTSSRWRVVGSTASGSSSGGREVLSADRTYYVRTDGSDSNNGLANTSGGAFLTIQKAINVVGGLDLGIYNVTIQVGSGTFNGAITVGAPWVGFGSVTLLGDTTTPANVVLSVTSSDLITALNYGRLNVAGLKFTTTTSGSALAALVNGSITITGKCDFGACATAHMLCASGGTITCISRAYNITGGAAYHVYCQAMPGVTIFGTTITISGTPNFSSQTVVATNNGYVRWASNSVSGSATGVRYAATAGGQIQTDGGGTSVIPGNSAGSGTNLGTSPYGHYS